MPFATGRPALEARALEKSFGHGRSRRRAVDGLDLAVPAGSVYGLLGRNGAGKTTALRLLTGVLRPDGGSARVLGTDPWQAPPELRARVAYVPQTQQLHDWMTLRELGRYLAFLHPRWDEGLAARLALRFGLEPGRRLGALSGGEQRKVSVLAALAARPEVLVLDEPAANLDPLSRRELREALVEHLASEGDTTVLLSTHLVEDLERLADHVAFMDAGRILHAAPLVELQESARRVQVVLPEGARGGLAIPGAVRQEQRGPVVSAVTFQHEPLSTDELRRRLQSAHPGARVDVFPLGLEDIFVELMGARSDERERAALTESRS
jgi:ABC-2 type transport system ATP-binding protein